MKRKLNKAALLLAGLIALTSFSACENLLPNKTKENGVQALCENALETTLTAGEQTEINIGKVVGNKNYLTK